jgi:ribosomal RNA-processing protein 36
MEAEDNSSDSSSYDSQSSEGEESATPDVTAHALHDTVSIRQRLLRNADSLEEASSDDLSTESRSVDEPSYSEKSSLPLEYRLKSVEVNDEEREETVREARRRKKLAKEEATRRLAALRASKVIPESKTDKPRKEKKNRPTEASSKRGDFFRNRGPPLAGSGHGVDLGAHRYKPMDPRGNTLAGHFDQDHFAKNYAFVSELKVKEINVLKRRISARQLTGRRGQKKRRALGITMDGSTLEEDKARLKDLQQQLATQARQQIDTSASRTVKKELRETAARVGKPVFLKRKELKRRTDEAKLQQIQEKQGEKSLEKFILKRRKREKSRDAKRQARGSATVM